ncbi:coenzyme F420 hydrogenase [Clostridiales bacterium TF09-2AC]|nr:coenzyme F420 hydrogenase [Clostridiales bacterium TF09-2AC]
MSVSLFNYKDECCCCGSCLNICPKSAINIMQSDCGFSYPTIDFAKCVNCGLCKTVCAFQKEIEYSQTLYTYAAINMSADILKNSSSGGCFSSLASAIIKLQGVVYGAELKRRPDDGFKCQHTRITQLSDLTKLQGSKYVQSDTGGTFSEARKDLEAGKLVLYSGTPCQIAGLYSYLRNGNYTNLITIDLICHGVPNIDIFNSYIKELEDKIGHSIIDFKFRSKIKGWGLSYSYSYHDQQDDKIITKIKPYYTSSYYTLFLDSQIYRESCYRCPYACSKRCGDFTLGDYWGIEQEHPEFINRKKIDVSKGVSLLLINTKKGTEFFKFIRNDFEIQQSAFAKAAHWNKQLAAPSKSGEDRKLIFELYKKRGYKAIERHYRKRYAKTIVKERIKVLIPNSLLKLIKVFIYTHNIHTGAQ